MGSVSRRGVDEMFAGLRSRVKVAGTFTTLHFNESEAARYLQARNGFFVYNPAALADTVARAAKRIAARTEPLTRAIIREELDTAAREAVAFHRRYVGGSAPPIRAGGPPRPKRAGGWADRRGVTADSYDVTVDGRRVPNLPGPEGERLI